MTQAATTMTTIISTTTTTKNNSGSNNSSSSLIKPVISLFELYCDKKAVVYLKKSIIDWFQPELFIIIITLIKPVISLFELYRDKKAMVYLKKSIMNWFRPELFICPEFRFWTNILEPVPVPPRTEYSGSGRSPIALLQML